jgi:hypothetical protein
MEDYQNENGEVTVPDALQPDMRGAKKIKAANQVGIEVALVHFLYHTCGTRLGRSASNGVIWRD